MAYEYAVGHNNEAGLTVVSIQPSSPGIAVTLQRDGNGLAHIKGKGRVPWVYSPAISATEYEALLVEFGNLNYFDTPSLACTIRTALNEEATGANRDFGNFNAWISIPPDPKFKWFWNGPVFEFLIDLEAL